MKIIKAKKNYKTEEVIVFCNCESHGIKLKLYTDEPEDLDLVYLDYFYTGQGWWYKRFWQKMKDIWEIIRHGWASAHPEVCLTKAQAKEFGEKLIEMSDKMVEIDKD